MKRSHSCTYFIILASLLSVFNLANAAEFATADGKLKMKTTPNATHMVFEITCTTGGWAAIGFGNKMADADVMMVYTKGGKAVVEDRTSTARVLPPLSKVQASMLESSKDGSYYKFSRSLAFSDAEHRRIDKGKSPMIWAYSSSPVGDRPAIHSDYGNFVIDLYSNDVSVGSANNKTTMLIAHGVLMFLAWIIFSPAAIFIARYMKSSLGVWWFRSHVGFLSMAVIFTIISFALAVTVTSSDDHFKDPHNLIGLIIFIMAILQSALGHFIDKMFDPNRREIPWYDKLHWWMGRFLFLFAIANVLYGIYIFAGLKPDLQATSMIFLYLTGGIVGLIVLLFLFGQCYIGQTHHEEPAAPENYQEYMAQYYSNDNLFSEKL
jgi:uncharacterized membrane protein YidH (DUF202 family)